MEHISYNYSTKFGKMRITVSPKGLRRISFYSNDSSHTDRETPLHKAVFLQINGYLKGDLKQFDLSLDLEGTDFQNKVWRYIYNIPYGTTVSYKEIANDIGHPKAFRAVGSANNRNPIPVICACHRVIGSSGDLVGYAYGLDMKRDLLTLEGISLK